MSSAITIGDFILKVHTSELVHDNESVKLEPLPLAFLCFLIENNGIIVTRTQLLESVWNNRVVSDDSIRKVVKRLREVFNDDAKSPKYIKTVPLKGYCLIATVKLPKSNEVKLKEVGFITTVLITFILILVFMWSINNDVTVGMVLPVDAEPRVESLTTLSGSSLLADYNENLNSLFFLSRNNNMPWSIYIKNLDSSSVNRLTWDNNNYIKVKVSKDGKGISYMVSNGVKTEIYIARFESERGIVNSKSITKSPLDLKNLDLLSWSHDGKTIYFSAGVDSEGSSIYNYDVIDKTFKQITFPNVDGAGAGDYLAQESSDGKYLAVLRNTSDRRYSLMIIELSTMKLQSQHRLPFEATSFVWLSDNINVALSSFEGDFYYFSLFEKELSKQKGTHSGLNDVFAVCGVNCFYMRQHSVKYSEIRELPIPFNTIVNKPLVYIETKQADFNPIYNSAGDTLYYSTNGEEKTEIVRYKTNHGSEILFGFDSIYLLSNLSVNKQETKLLGKIEGRIFIIDLNNKEIKYLTTDMETVDYPTWDATGSKVYFSRIENNNVNLFQYDIDNDKLIKKLAGVVQLKELADGQKFYVNENNNLFQVVDDSTVRLIKNLPLLKYSQWQIVRGFIYLLHFEDNSTYLERINISSNQSRKIKISNDTNILNFYIHPSGEKIVVSQSLLANSNLVKVNWPANNVTGKQ
ncbi:winged helix-turn-helix domain-containing protein [Shewanella baltica]|uniref:winged helix-turn-helix domain-containing protein n=1 Tax=Shewanella baltica TaxID=62322 RepID=UPI00325D8A6D